MGDFLNIETLISIFIYWGLKESDTLMSTWTVGHWLRFCCFIHKMWSSTENIKTHSCVQGYRSVGPAPGCSRCDSDTGSCPLCSHTRGRTCCCRGAHTHPRLHECVWVCVCAWVKGKQKKECRWLETKYFSLSLFFVLTLQLRWLLFSFALWDSKATMYSIITLFWLHYNISNTSSLYFTLCATSFYTIQMEGAVFPVKKSPEKSPPTCLGKWKCGQICF